MNKKLLKSFAAAAMSVLAIACAKEQVGPGEGAMVEATFSVDVPGVIGTKAGEGTKATKLYYQVFDAEGAPVTGLPMQEKVINGSTTVNFQLIKDQTYNFVFWAQTAEDGYYTVTDLRTITANYEGKNSNDENFDAFFAVEKAITINGPITKTVTLKRPFAQINVATTDVLKAGETTVNVDFRGATSAVTVKDVPTVFSPLTDKLSSPVNALQFASAAIPGGDFAVIGSTETYKYLAVNYVFAPVDGTVYDVEAALNVAGKDVTVKVPSVPAKRNYRTNIYGNLLTTTADFNVEIDPGFAGNENMEMWDGSADAVTEVDGVYEIKNAAQLAWVSQQVNSGATTFSGKTVKLVDDIYLGGKSWTPIGTVVSTPSVAFSGTFDGNRKTIHDLNASDNTPKHSTAGLFGSVVSATIQDLTIENAIVKSNHYAGVICGFSEGESKILNCKVSNVSVTSAPELIGAKWDNGDKVGGIAGYIVSAEVKGCTVDNAAIQGYRDLGGIVGYANTTSEVTGNALKGIVTITVDKSHNYKEYTSETEYDANPYVGEKSDVATVSDNTGEASIYSTGIVSTQEELDAAIADVAEGETATVTLGAGEFTTYDNTSLKGKNVTVSYVGAGADKTTFAVGTDNHTNGEANGDYSLDGVTKASFKNMTIKVNNDNYRGYIRVKELEFENCVFENRISYWGEGKVTFKNCTFNQTAEDYNLWTYSGTDFLFDGCTFNSPGKCINAYKDGGQCEYKITIRNCHFVSTKVNKSVVELKANSSHKYTLCFEGENTSDNFKVSELTGSALYNSNDGEKDSSVFVDRVQVWTDGHKVE